MTKSFAEALRETRRLVLLRLLSERNGYTANSSILLTGLTALGVASSHDDVLNDLHWLKDQDLVTLTTPIPGVEVATVHRRGQEVAAGTVIVPGVQRPSAR